MDHPKLKILVPVSILLLFLPFFAIADDTAYMSKLAKGLSNPSDWSDKTPFCKWTGVNCDISDRVTSINLASKSISGTLPSGLNSLSRLTSLSLQNNALSGALPSFANLSLLHTVFLDCNNFTSVPPGCFKGLTSLQTLSLGNNINLKAWTFPTDLTQSSNPSTLELGNANIVGSLPDIFDSFPSLQNVRLSYNNLTGGLPKTFGGSGIMNLWLNNQLNGLSGTIDVLSSMKQLSQVWLHKNQFTGPIPDLSKCKRLFDLQLRDNQLTGAVPRSLMSLSSLQNVSLDNNELQGPIPEFGSGLKVTIDGNSFCKSSPGACDARVMTLLEIAAALGYPFRLAGAWKDNHPCNAWSFIVCTNGKITTVNMAKQNFQGTISPAFGNLTDLRNLYLNGNNLSGSIPESLTTLPELVVLDVSSNNLSGEVPKFSSKLKLKTTGNLLLGKTPSSGGERNGSSPTTGTSLSPGWIAGIVIIGLLFLAVALYVSCKCYAKIRHKKFGRVNDPENGNGCDQGGNATTSIQVLRQATNNFSEDNILGRGGFGVVYKGELHDGTKIAVKMMESVAMGNKGLNEFQVEIAVLSKVRHRNLVALKGYCINGNERHLVYEYMPQGTLEQHLFKWREKGCAPLTWKQRVAIAMDVARGVEYLHSLAQQSFIHRDLKPANILLGDDMRAKVADFGLVKTAPDGKYSVETTRVAGTLGYVAPEYAATGRVTTKVDVYAFGVVLMELITGRRALDNTVPDERSHLVSWLRKVLINKEEIPENIDHTLDADEETMESIYKVAQLARHCTAHEASQRPDMGHAVNVLVPLVEQWQPTNHEEEEGYGSLPQALQRWQANEGTSAIFNETGSGYFIGRTGQAECRPHTDPLTEESQA